MKSQVVSVAIAVGLLLLGLAAILYASVAAARADSNSGLSTDPTFILSIVAALCGVRSTVVGVLTYRSGERWRRREFDLRLTELEQSRRQRDEPDL
jgi:hypothetical protein